MREPGRATAVRLYRYVMLLLGIPSAAAALAVLVIDRVAPLALDAGMVGWLLGWLAAAAAIAACSLALHIALLLEPASWRGWDGALVLGLAVAALGLFTVAVTAHAGSITPGQWAALPMRHRWLGVPTFDWEFRLTRHRPIVYLADFVSTVTVVIVFGGQWFLRLLLWDRGGGTRWFYFLH